MGDLVRVCIQAEMNDEEIFFKEEDAKLIRDLRDKNKIESDQQYRDDHSCSGYGLDLSH